MEQEKKKGLKEFGLSSLSVNNKVTVFVITTIILIMGISSYIAMPREAFPEIVMPEIYVGVPYPGNSPLDIEKLITRPLEKEINTITGIDKLTSTSAQGFSTIQIKFSFDITPAQALRKVKDAVDKVKSHPSFPKDLPADPNVFEMNFSEQMPVMNVNLSGDFSMDMLKEYGERIEDKIEEVPQVTKVDIRGVQEKEVKILLDVQKMEAMQIGFRDIEGAIANENMTISGGDVIVDGLRRTVRTVGEFNDWRDIENIIVKQEKFNIIYLRDIAKVEFAPKDIESFAREFGSPVVMLDVFKRGGENLLDASDAISAIIDDLTKNEFPESLVVTITNDMSDKTRTQVADLENSIIFGMILVVGVLLFFLGLRNALFVGLAIPLSMFTAFMVLSAMGVTLNMMVLFSLVLALGMLVDNGIVIVENIYRLMDEGYSNSKAAMYGAGEVAWPIIASTATTLAAFLPLAIWPGMMGEFMFYLPMTLMIVLGSSLFVALVINPVFTSVFMKVDETTSTKKRTMLISGGIALLGATFTLSGAMGFGNFLIFMGIMVAVNAFVLSPATKSFQNGFLPVLENGYQKFLSFALSGAKPYLFLVGIIFMLGLSGGLLKVFMPKMLFFPINQPTYLNTFISLPIGTDIDETNAVTLEVEKRIKTYFEEEITTEDSETLPRNFIVQSVIAQVGKGASDPAQGVSLNNTPEKARVMISFVEFVDRKGVKTSAIMGDLRERLNGIPGVQIVVDKNQDGPPQGKPINIEISGDDYQGLIDEAERMKQFIIKSKIPGIEELKLDIEVGKPELIVKVDRQKARRLNVSTAQIGSTIRTALFGKEVSKYKDGEDDYDIVIRMEDGSRYNQEALLNQRITFRDPANGKISQVPISSVATLEKSSTFSAVKRKDLERLVTIQSNVLEEYNPTEVVEAIKERLKDYEKSEGTKWKFTGQQEEQAKEMAFLSSALMFAVFLIFLIIVAQFNSISAPFIIVFSVVLSLIGVFLGLVIFQMDFIIIMTMIGIISLAGIVVNNAIVLIDYTMLLMKRKANELNLTDGAKLTMDQVIETIVEGGKTRLRPVLLTAITTVLGLLPMAVGLNINFFTLFSELDAHMYIGGDNVVFWGPMSWTIIFGLTFATFLTLVIIPVMVLIATKIKYAVFKTVKY
ncbi:MAG: efflux RND transporter permease subunit [Flavobacteriales bacterium]|nr:efflux RND transporter permease subunit [Flavobacteriales bacterium]